MNRFDKAMLVNFIEENFDQFVEFCARREWDEHEAGFVLDQLREVEEDE